MTVESVEPARRTRFLCLAVVVMLSIDDTTGFSASLLFSWSWYDFLNASVLAMAYATSMLASIVLVICCLAAVVGAVFTDGVGVAAAVLTSDLIPFFLIVLISIYVVDVAPAATVVLATVLCVVALGVVAAADVVAAVVVVTAVLLSLFVATVALVLVLAALVVLTSELFPVTRHGPKPFNPVPLHAWLELLELVPAAAPAACCTSEMTTANRRRKPTSK